MTRLRSVALSALICGGAFWGGCSASDSSEEGSLASEQSDLYYVGAHWGKWSNRGGSPKGADITVCYRSDGSQAADAFALHVRQWVEQTWGRVLDVNFHGWQRCGAGVQRGSLVMNLVNGGGSRTQFYQGTNSETASTLDYTETRQPVAVVHEFGHALGFAHEFNRGDWTFVGGLTCNSNADCTNGDWGPTCQLNPSDGKRYCRNTAYTPESPTADYQSVMAATYFTNTIDQGDRGNGLGGAGPADPIHSLSSWDVLGAQNVYGTKAAGSILGLGNKCANFAGGLTGIGQQLIAWDCFDIPNDTFATFSSSSTSDRLMVFAPAGSNFNNCMNVQGGVVSPTNWTNLISWPCTLPGTLATNEWINFTGMKLRAMGNMCVTATGTTAGSQLVLHTCGTQASAVENWDLTDTSAAGYLLRLSNTNLCVTEPATLGLGVRPTLQTCPFSGATHVFNNGEIHVGNYCYNVLGGTTDEGSAIGLWDGCGNGIQNEQFYLTGPIHSMGQCMDMFGGVSDLGVPIGVYPCFPNAQNQEWDYHF